MTDTSEEAAKRRAAEQLSAATAAMVTQGNIEAERAEAEKKAKKEAKRKVRDRAATWRARTRGGGRCGRPVGTRCAKESSRSWQYRWGADGVYRRAAHMLLCTGSDVCL
jgi:hypothetical protein